LGDEQSSSSGGKAIGAAGETTSGGREDGSAGSVGATTSGGSGASSTGGAGTGGGGTGAVGGIDPLGGAGESSTSAGAAIGGEAGAPACVPETTAALCKRIGKDCDSVDATDNCGTAVVAVSCGTCVGFKMCGGSGQDNVCGALTDPALGGVATASSVGSIAENGSKAFDLNVNTKWFAGDASATGWLAYQFPGTTSHVVHSYSITSANDVPERDPTAWQLQGSNDGGTWVTVDQRTAQVFAARHQTNPYTCSNLTPYRWYRLLITANGGAPALQLAELALYGD
jgi:hypothetical protein